MRRAILPALLLAFAIACVPCLRAQGGNPADGDAVQDTGGEATEGPAIAAPLPRGKKLVLTDGNYQVVREYERRGDRVRYYSVERSSWEEIPADMVDWAATERAGAEAAASQKETLDRIRDSAAKNVAATIDTGSSLQVGSGVFLPDGPGFYVLNGQTVLGLMQVATTTRVDKGRAVLKGISGIPFISSKQFIELPGKQAKVRIQSVEPEFYIRTDDGRLPKLTLVRAEITGEKRHLTTAIIDIVGNTKFQGNEVPILTSEAAHGVQRLVMSEKLQAGEYALLETTGEGLNSYVWEFGVDAAPGAPASKPAKGSKARPAKK